MWFRTEYNRVAKKVVHALKFTYAREAAELIAKELMTTLPHLPDGMIITHVPAASSHVRLRGFDQSALIARELSKLTGIRHVHLLGRLGQERQVGSSKAARLSQMASAFRPLAPSMISNANIILVDDVLTTGSTIEAAALTLKQAGARSVNAAVFAQA